jgi:hypothetical protein|tara:strand:- start:74 stop:226 length:153 start_codon:yes stop_codon:yes gene_type:complete
VAGYGKLGGFFNCAPIKRSIEFYALNLKAPPFFVGSACIGAGESLLSDCR